MRRFLFVTIVVSVLGGALEGVASEAIGGYKTKLEQRTAV